MNLFLTVLTLLAVRSAAFAPIAPRPTASSRLQAAEDDSSTSSAPALEIESSDPYQSYVANSSPLAFIDTFPGTGDPAADGSVLTCSFAGRVFTSGKQFEANEAFVFKMGSGNVMPGFDQGLWGVRVGGKRTLRIPSKLAYGPTGKRPKIPPNAYLEIDVEVLKITEGVMGEVSLFGEQKATQLAGLVGVFIFAPFLEKGAYIVWQQVQQSLPF